MEARACTSVIDTSTARSWLNTEAELFAVDTLIQGHRMCQYFALEGSLFNPTNLSWSFSENPGLESLRAEYEFWTDLGLDSQGRRCRQWDDPEWSTTYLLQDHVPGTGIDAQRLWFAEDDCSATEGLSMQLWTLCHDVTFVVQVHSPHLSTEELLDRPDDVALRVCAVE